jgi:hypothetical protein
MAVIELFQHAVESAAQPLVLAYPKDLRNLVGRQAEDT